MQAATLKKTYCQNRSDFLALKSMQTYQWAPAKETMCPEKYLIRPHSVDQRHSNAFLQYQKESTTFCVLLQPNLPELWTEDCLRCLDPREKSKDIRLYSHTLEGNIEGWYAIHLMKNQKTQRRNVVVYLF